MSVVSLNAAVENGTIRSHVYRDTRRELSSPSKLLIAIAAALGLTFGLALVAAIKRGQTNSLFARRPTNHEQRKRTEL